MKTLDLTKPVQTRTGTKGRIISTALSEPYPIGAILTGADGVERFDCFTLDGSVTLYPDRDHDGDLVNTPEPAEQVYNWLKLRANSHLLDAVTAFNMANKKITGIKFIRSVVPASVTGWTGLIAEEPAPEIGCGLTPAKEAFERIAREANCAW